MRKEQEEFLTRFMDKFKDPLNNPRMAKCQSLYYLALAAKGPIVELGTYHGCGAIALGFGAKDGNDGLVFTVDDYQSRTGWAGEPYEPEDEGIAWQHIMDAGVEVWMSKMTVQDYAKTEWAREASLIFWDTAGGELEKDVQALTPHLQKGGIFAIHDTTDRTFGSDKVFGDNWLTLPELPGMIYSASRIK